MVREYGQKSVVVEMCNSAAVVQGTRLAARFFRGPFGPGLSFPVNSLTSCIARFFGKSGNSPHNFGAFLLTDEAAFLIQVDQSRPSLRRQSATFSIAFGRRGGSSGNSLNTASRFTRTFSKSPCPLTRSWPRRHTLIRCRSPPTRNLKPAPIGDGHFECPRVVR